MTEQVEYRHVSFGQLETRLDGDERSFSGYANLHEKIDSYGTRFAQGAWQAGGLDETRQVYLWMHSPDNPIGVFTAKEDERGLYIEGRYDETDEGERARLRAKSGSAPELSVGFVREADEDNGTRITSAKLKEVSQITLGFASQRGAELVAMRAAAEAIQQLDSDIPAEVEDFPSDELVSAVVDLEDTHLTDEPLPEEDRASAPDKSSVPGSNAAQLKAYWTKGKGLALWKNSPKPYTTLLGFLAKYIKDPEMAKATAAKWFMSVMGETPAQHAKKAKGKRMDAETIEARYEELEKRWGDSYVGSYEQRIRLVSQAVRAWANEEYPRNSVMDEPGFYAYPEATYSDRVLVNVEGKERQSMMLFDYEVDPEGAVVLSNPRAAKVTTTVSTEGAESRSVEEEDNDAAEPEDAEQRLAELNARLVQARIATTKIA